MIERYARPRDVAVIGPPAVEESAEWTARGQRLSPAFLLIGAPRAASTKRKRSPRD